MYEQLKFQKSNLGITCSYNESNFLLFFIHGTQKSCSYSEVVLTASVLIVRPIKYYSLYFSARTFQKWSFNESGLIVRCSYNETRLYNIRSHYQNPGQASEKLTISSIIRLIEQKYLEKSQFVMKILQNFCKP